MRYTARMVYILVSLRLPYHVFRVEWLRFSFVFCTRYSVHQLIVIFSQHNMPPSKNNRTSRRTTAKAPPVSKPKGRKGNRAASNKSSSSSVAMDAPSQPTISDIHLELEKYCVHQVPSQTIDNTISDVPAHENDIPIPARPQIKAPIRITLTTETYVPGRAVISVPLPAVGSFIGQQPPLTRSATNVFAPAPTANTANNSRYHPLPTPQMNPSTSQSSVSSLNNKSSRSPLLLLNNNSHGDDSRRFHSPEFELDGKKYYDITMKINEINEKLLLQEAMQRSLMRTLQAVVAGVERLEQVKVQTAEYLSRGNILIVPTNYTIGYM
jgi:hypothetical protein